MEERRGKGRVWSEGRLVFIGEVRSLAAFVHVEKLYYYFTVAAVINAGVLYYILTYKHIGAYKRRYVIYNIYNIAAVVNAGKY